MNINKLWLYWIHLRFLLLHTNDLRKVIMGVANESTYAALSKELHRHHRIHLHWTTWPMESLERVMKRAFKHESINLSSYPGAMWNLMTLCRDSLSPHQSHSEYIAPRIDYCWAADTLKPYVKGDAEDIKQMYQTLTDGLHMSFAEEPSTITVSNAPLYLRPNR